MATRSDPDGDILYDELQGTPARPQTGYTWDLLMELHEEDPRHQIIGGELIVTAAPNVRHQRVAQRLAVILSTYEKEHGGVGLGLPVNLYLSEHDVVEPDCVYLRPENMGKLEENRIVGPPDLLVEISSPTTRRLDLKRKKELYERHGVPEYWFVDLDAENVQVYRLTEGRYGFTRIASRGETLGSPLLPGLSVPIDELFA